MTASPAQTLGQFLEMLGERPGGWYAYPVMLATLRQKPHQWFTLDVLTVPQFERLQRELEGQATYPWTYEAVQYGDGKVIIRAVAKPVRSKGGGKPAPRASALETDPEQYLGPPRPNVDYLVGGEHDPNLSSEIGDISE